MFRFLGRHVLIVLIFANGLFADGFAQESIDLFSNAPELGDGFVRVGTWNLRHINLESGGAAFLPGSTREEDFEILTATFGQGIKDLELDLVAIAEHQPRLNEPNRLHQIRDWLNGDSGGPWRADETDIVYDNGGNLQFGLLWDSDRIMLDPTADQLLHQLRQPRLANGEIESRNLRVPWLVPVTAGDLSFDLLILHLKSGGQHPQADEVQALQDYIAERQSVASPKHLIVCGDWNIRPDQSSGRARLRQIYAL